MKASEQIDFAIIVKKQSQTGIFKNQRLLLIKSGFISYFSNIPKYYVGNIRSIQLSGQLPKMTLSAAEVESIERKRKYIHMKFNKKHLINMEKFKKYMEGDEGKTKGNIMGDEIQQWIFKCENVEEAELFIKQIMYYKSDPTHKPELARAISGYKDGKKGFRPSSIRPSSPSTSGFANRYSEQPSMAVNKERPNAISFDEKQLNNKTIDIFKNIENVIPENIQQQQLSQDDKSKIIDQKKQQSQVKNQDVLKQKDLGKMQKMQIQQVDSKLIQKQAAKQEAPFILPEQKEFKESKQALFTMPVQIEEKSTYSREKFPYYPYLKAKKSSKKQQLKQLSLKQARLSGKKLLDKLSSNKIIPTNTKNEKILITNKEKFKLRLEKRSHTLQATAKQQQVEENRTQQQKEGEGVKRNSSWSELKRLKRSFSLIESILQNNCAQKLEKQEKQEAQELIVAKNDHGIDENLNQVKEQIKTFNLDGESFILDYQPNQVRKEIFEQKKQEDCPKISETFGQSNTFKNEQSVLDLSKMLDNFTKLDETSISGDHNNNFEADSFFNSDQKQQHFKYHMSRDHLPLTEDDNKIQSPIYFKNELKSIINSGGQLKQIKESIKSDEQNKTTTKNHQKDDEQRIDIMKSLEKLLEVERLKLNNQLEQEQKIKIKEGIIEKKQKTYSIQIQQERHAQQIKKAQDDVDIIKISEEIVKNSVVAELQQKQSEIVGKSEKSLLNTDANNESNRKRIDNFQLQIKQKVELVKQQNENNKASSVQNEEKIKQYQQLQIQKTYKTNSTKQNAEDVKQQTTFGIQTYKSRTDNSITELEIIKEQEGTSELNSENSIKEQIKDLYHQGQLDSLSLEKDDDCISFKNLQINEPQKYMPQPQSLTPRFWQQVPQQVPAIDISKRKEQFSRNKGRVGGLLFLQQKQIASHNFEILNRERERKRTLVEKEQVKKQCYRFTQKLLNKKTQNKVGQTVCKIVKKMLEKSELKIPVQICLQLLQLKKQNEIKKIAVELMICEVDHSREQDSKAIMFGARRKWNGWCLFVYQSYETYSSVIKFYQQLMSQIDKNLPNESCRIPHIYMLGYKGKHGIFIQAPQQCFQSMVPKRIEPILKKILGQQFYEQNLDQISTYENIKNSELIVWVNPDYLHGLLQNKERNWQRRISWFDTLNSTIEQSQVQNVSELAVCAWQEYLQESKRKQTISATQRIQILKILFSTYFLTLKSGTNDQIEVHTFCKVTNSLSNKQKKQSQCYIDTLYTNLTINEYTQQQKRDILIFKAIKIISQSEIHNGQFELVGLQHFLLTLAEFFLTKQLFQQSYQIICYCLSLIMGEQVLALNMNQINLMHTKVLLISLESQQGKVIQIYKGFLRNLFLHFYCYSRLHKQKGNIQQLIDLLTGTIRMLEQIRGLAQYKQISLSQNKQIINQITYHKILIQDVFLSDHVTLQTKQFLVCLDEQKAAAQFLIEKSECIDKYSLTAFNAILKYIDHKIQLSSLQEAAQITSKFIEKLTQMHGSRQQINELLTQLRCRLDICRIHNNSNTLVFGNFIQYLKFYITHFNEANKINSKLPFFERSNRLSMIRKIVKVLCFKFCCNDFTSICCLIKTLKTLNLDQEDLKQLLKQGWSMLEPEIRKRVQNKELL